MGKIRQSVTLSCFCCSSANTLYSVWTCLISTLEWNCPSYSLKRQRTKRLLTKLYLITWSIRRGIILKCIPAVSLRKKSVDRLLIQTIVCRYFQQFKSISILTSEGIYLVYDTADRGSPWEILRNVLVWTYLLHVPNLANLLTAFVAQRPIMALVEYDIRSIVLYIESCVPQSILQWTRNSFGYLWCAFSPFA